MEKKEFSADNYLTNREAATLFKTTTKTLQRMRKKGVLTAYKFGHQIRFKNSELLAFLNSQKESTNA
jgi:excisionase family DNA binding protein